MFKGPAALTGASTAVDLAATGAVTVGTTLDVTGASALTGGATLGAALAMGNFKITGLGTPTAGTDAVTKTYADGLGGGALSADVTSNDADIDLAPNTTYFIASATANAFNITEGTLAAGSLVRFVIVSGSTSVAITGVDAIGGSALVPMSGTAGNTLTLVGVGHSAQFVFKSNKLYVVSGGGTIS